jgi:hypothetical protein
MRSVQIIKSTKYVHTEPRQNLTIIQNYLHDAHQQNLKISVPL